MTARPRSIAGGTAASAAAPFSPQLRSHPPTRLCATRMELGGAVRIGRDGPARPDGGGRRVSGEIARGGSAEATPPGGARVGSILEPQRREGRGRWRRKGDSGHGASPAGPSQADRDEVGAIATAGDDLRISVCCAGVGWAEKVAGKRGPHQFEPFRIAVTVSLIGAPSASCARPAALMLASEPDDGTRVRHRSSRHRLGRHLRRPDKPGSPTAASRAGIVRMTLPKPARATSRRAGALSADDIAPDAVQTYAAARRAARRGAPELGAQKVPPSTASAPLRSTPHFHAAHIVENLGNSTAK